MLWVLIRSANEYPQHMFSQRNKNTISTFGIKQCLIWSRVTLHCFAQAGISEYSEPSLQQQHLFPKTNLLLYRILNEQIDM